MFLKQITDPALAQNAYLIGCQRTGEAIIIDPERDVDRYLALAAENGFRLTAVADTHIHADYLSGARELVERHDATGYFSREGGPDWQFEWAGELPKVRLIGAGDTFQVGNIELKALLTPGHTPEHLSFLVTDRGGGADEPVALLSGDFIFVGDVGRPDLLESAAGQQGVMRDSARALYESLRSTRGLPEFVQILPGHGAGSACGKALGAVPVSVLGYERRFNRPLREALEGGCEGFVASILEGQPEPPLYFARMKRDNRRGPDLLPEGRVPKIGRIDVSDLGDWVGAAGRVVIDTRGDRGAFMAGHVKGSLFAPLAGGKLPLAAGSYVGEDEEILLVLEDERQADEALRQLLRIGLDRVRGWISVADALKESRWVASIRRAETSELASLMEEFPGAAVLDVRGASEFEEGHVEGATNLAYTRLAADGARLPDGSPLLIHCGSGLRAAMAAAGVARTGRQVIHVDGPFGGIPRNLRASP